MILTGWRISKPKFSHTPQEIMSGEGAYLFGGRWNSKGTRVVYMGTSLAQASMELLVHLGRSEILNSYVKIAISFDDSLLEHIDVTELPLDWAWPEMASSVQQVGDDWVKSKSSPVLQVPSAAIVGEYNYIVNPEHPEYKKLRLSEITPYNFDPRLIK